jgi:hypothetical protein
MASHKSLSINAPVKSSPSYVRQSLSATRVIHLLNAEFPEHLPPLPIVPYALGVALSVVYRHFRSRRLKVHVNRATEELKQCVRLLDRLRNAWWSAGTMADLGRAVLNNAAGRATNAANTPATVTTELRPSEPKTEPHDSTATEQRSAVAPAPPFRRIPNRPTPSPTPTSASRSITYDSSPQSRPHAHARPTSHQ